MSTDLIKRLRDALACKLRQNGFEAANGPLVRTTEQLRVLVEADAHLLSAGQSREKWLTRCDEYINTIAGGAIGLYEYELVTARHNFRIHLRAVPDTPTADLDRIAALERENAELQELLLKQRELTGSFITSSAIIASENQRLRAHIQEAADRCQTIVLNFTKLSGGACSPTHPQIVKRDWHLAALQPKEPTK